MTTVGSATSVSTANYSAGAMNRSHHPLTCPPVEFTPYHHKIRNVELLVLGIVLFLALIGNSCVMIALWQRRAKPSRMHLFIMHLAAADLIVALFQVLPEFLMRLFCGFHAGDELCRLVKYFQILGMYGSTYVLLCAAFDRFKAIRYPMQSFKTSRKRVHVTIAIAWGMSALLAAPQLFLFHKYEPKSACIMIRRSRQELQAYVTWFFVAILVFPTCMLVYFYGMIAATIMRNLIEKNRAAKTSNSSRASSTKEEHQKGNYAPRASSTAGISRAKIKTVKMTLVIVITYVFCWAPFFTVQLLDVWGITNGGIANGIFNLLASLNSCTNPWIYMCFSGSLFSDFKRFISCKEKKPTSFKIRNVTSTQHANTRRHDVKEIESTMCTSSYCVDSPIDSRKFPTRKHEITALIESTPSGHTHGVKE